MIISIFIYIYIVINKNREIKRFCDVVINFVDSIIKSNSVKSIEWDGEIFHYYIVNNENNELIKLSLSNYKQNCIFLYIVYYYSNIEL